MTADSLRVPGANLYYKIEGSGPLLLLLQGGDGDADATDAIVGHLADRYAVLTYDRRGLSRSTIDDPTAPLELSTHTEDASRLLSSLTEAPVRVFGASIGALLGLDLITRHPEQVLLLLAHEPPATELLADPEREAAVRGQEEVEDLYRREGIGVAMRRFVALAGVDPNDREPDVDIAPPKPERVANLAFFLTHDAPAVRRYRLNLPALREHASRIVTAAGRSPGGGFVYECAEALAHALGKPLIEFPGGHAGFVLRPREFATRLLEVLDGAG
jgi:pimeloyl-ACP methyl ester carboxylesterase